MMRRHFSSVQRFLSCAIALVLLGCTSYEPAEDSGQEALNENAAREIVASGDSVEVRLVPLFDAERARPYLGIDPSRSKIMPVLLNVANAGPEPIKVELQDSYLSAGPDERWRTLALKEAVDRALRSDADVFVLGLAFGMPVWFIAADNAAATNRTLEEDYHAKYFQPTLINAGASGQGVVFFDLPRNEKWHVSAAVIRVRQLNTDHCQDIRLAVEEDVPDKRRP
jgi:hypothetical protein